MKGDKYAKTLVKIRVRGIFRKRNRDLYGDAIQMSTNMADGNQQKYLLPSEYILRGTHKH